MKKTIIIAALLFGMLTEASWAQTADDKPTTEKTEKAEKKDKKEKKEKKEKKKSGHYWKKVPGRLAWEWTKREEPKQAPKYDVDRPGMFNVKKKDKDWFFEIPDSLIGKDILVTTRFISTPSNTGMFGGEEINEQTVYFETVNKEKMIMRVHLLINAADTSNVISRAVTVSNANPIMAQFKIESHENGYYKLKMNDFLQEDNPITGMSQSMKRGFNLGQYLGQLTNIEDIKSFPTNTEVRMTKTWTSSSQSIPSARETERATFGINLSFVMLPEVPMATRFYDPRVGYFTVNYNQFTDEQQRVEYKRYIARWRLEPKDEDLEAYMRGELVEPKKPIVYYIDPATPKQWRKYLIQGVNDWQKAFEKAGFKNAIYALEWPEGKDSTMSMEDARYSMIRYLASPIENAYGPHVSDPRTGEILESHICWYHNVMSLVHDWYMVQASSIDEAARKMNYDEELMGQLIRFVSSHEVGHTLGLRHNFGASSTVPVENLRNKAWVEAHGHTPSIMDYARFNYVAQPEDGISQEGIFPRINDYDEWAIRWGYTYYPDVKTPEDDYAKLDELYKKYYDGNPRLWWGDGEGLRGVDPRRQTEDLGDDAMKASEYGIMNLKRELQNLPQWTYEKNDIYNENLARMANQIHSQFYRYLGHVINNIGGTYVTFRTQAQGGTKYENNPKERQKRAIEFIDKHALNEPLWMRDVPYASQLTNDTEAITFHIARNVARQLVYRTYELNTDYNAGEYLDDISDLILKEATAGQKVTRYRQELQKRFINDLIGLYNDGGDMKGYALRELKRIKTKIANANGTDAPTQAHWALLKDQIERALVIK